MQLTDQQELIIKQAINDLVEAKQLAKDTMKSARDNLKEVADEFGIDVNALKNAADVIFANNQGKDKLQEDEDLKTKTEEILSACGLSN